MPNLSHFPRPCPPSHRQHSPQFYGRRKGRALRTQQKKHLAWLLETYCIDASQIGHPPVTIEALFGKTPSNCYLEIGFGGGEHLAQQAQAMPDACFIGAEPFINGIASLARHIAERNLTNIRVWGDDVRLLLPALPSDCLDGVYILFPDPWPKNRHANRRLVQPPLLDDLALCLKSGGFLLMASDDACAKSWLLHTTCQHRQFAWQAQGANDWRMPPDHAHSRGDGYHTRYRAKAKASGRSASWFHFLRL